MERIRGPAGEWEWLTGGGASMREAGTSWDLGA